MVEGMSIRGTVLVTGVAKNTIVKLLADLGRACAEYQDGALVNLPSKRIECHQIWSFCHSTQENVPEEHEGESGYGDVWTWVAVDPDTKLVPSWLVGERAVTDADVFLSDLKSRLRYRMQMTTDGPRSFLTVCGEPNEALIALTTRMGMCRSTRFTNAFSTRVMNLAHAVSIRFMHHNFCRVHQSLAATRPDGKRIQQTPAIVAGVATHAWSVDELVALLEPPKSN